MFKIIMLWEVWKGRRKEAEKAARRGNKLKKKKEKSFPKVNKLRQSGTVECSLCHDDRVSEKKENLLQLKGKEESGKVRAARSEIEVINLSVRSDGCLQN